MKDQKHTWKLCVCETRGNFALLFMPYLGSVLAFCLKIWHFISTDWDSDFYTRSKSHLL